MLVLNDWSSDSSHTESAGGVSKEQEMEADKRALTLDVQQQHQRLILHQAFFFLDVRCVERTFPTDTDTNSIQQHSTADQNSV